MTRPVAPPRKKKPAKKPAKKPNPGRVTLGRNSPCARECSHVWCDGYNAGYRDGNEDGTNEERERR